MLDCSHAVDTPVLQNVPTEIAGIAQDRPEATIESKTRVKLVSSRTVCTCQPSAGGARKHGFGSTPAPPHLSVYSLTLASGTPLDAFFNEFSRHRRAAASRRFKNRENGEQT